MLLQHSARELRLLHILYNFWRGLNVINTFIHKNVIYISIPKFDIYLHLKLKIGFIKKDDFLNYYKIKHTYYLIFTLRIYTFHISLQMEKSLSEYSFSSEIDRCCSEIEI